MALLEENAIISLTTVCIIITVLGLIIGLSINDKCYDVLSESDNSVSLTPLDVA